MEVSSEEGGDIPIPSPTPINAASGGHGHHGSNGHGHHHQHDPLNGAAGGGGLDLDHDPDLAQPTGYGYGYGYGSSKKKLGSSGVVVVVKYRECLKNHAASMGGNATDGCGEFMASGDEGSLEALTCSACHCHRNFHRKELLPHHHSHFLLPPPSNVLPSRMIMPPHHHPLFQQQNQNQSEHKKRFRTKFTAEQKEKMLGFAERVGWKIQKQEESVVQQFCHEIGVKRRVLKVWMHNNKHNLANKNTTTASLVTPPSLIN